MRVILLDNVRKLGKLGEIVNVKSGYGRNYLIPQGIATLATPENEKNFEGKRVELEKKSQDLFVVAQAHAKELENLEITISAHSTDTGKLYGSIGPMELSDAIKEQTKVEISTKYIVLPNGPIRNIGEEDVVLQIHHDIEVKIKVHVIKD